MLKKEAIEAGNPDWLQRTAREAGI